MSILLNCPVCGRQNIETNICPNCETDLSRLRILLELPELQSPQLSRFLPWLILLPLLAIALAIAGFLWLPRLQLQGIQPESFALPPTTIVESSPPQQGCGGFYYTVTLGDSLSLIAQKFYTSLDNWELIATANPNIQARTNLLYVGETLFIPNLPHSCPHQE
jgi:hypothetical protein